MKLTVYPFEPFILNPGEISVIEMSLPSVNRDVTSFFVADTDAAQLFNDKNQVLNPLKDALWLGNPAYGIDYSTAFSKLIIKHVIETMDDQVKIKILDAERELSRQVIEASFLVDIPLEVRSGATLDAIMKFTGIHVEVPNSESICAKIELLFKILQEVDTTKLVVLTDVSHFIDDQELDYLVEQVTGTELTVLIIEYSETSRQSLFNKCRYYYIDKDWVDIR